MIDQVKQWVVVMFENRSFDNLLGHLPHLRERDGIRDRDIELSYPGGSVRVRPATDFRSPLPDPGEGFGNVNAQLWGDYIPQSNMGRSPYPLFPQVMDAPHNVPDGAPVPSMDGFALDYYGNFIWEKERIPTDTEMQSIGEMFTPETAPVINTLAEQYGVFTRWFCDVPTCTYPNRSFLLCGTSMGKVDNDNIISYAWNHTATNVFELMSNQGVDWKVYFSKDQVVPGMALMLGGLHSIKMWHDHQALREDFFADAAAGTLPTFSWVEPRLLFGDLDDYHPPTDIRSGEKFLAEVYNAVRKSPQWETTALLILFDEHGGTYDHVPPPSTVAPDDYPGEFGFEFDRLGVRVPAIVVSPLVERGTVIEDTFHNASVLATMQQVLGLGDPLTERVRSAPTLDAVFNRSSPRTDALAHLEGHPFEWVAPTRAEKAAALGDEPDAALLFHKKHHERTEHLSQLGQVTLRAVANLVGDDPAKLPTTGSGARRYLLKRAPALLRLKHFPGE